MNKGDRILVIVGGKAALVGPFRISYTPEIIEVCVVRVRGAELLWRRPTYESPSTTVRFADRGITWAPAWREEEAAAFRVAHALRDAA